MLRGLCGVLARAKQSATTQLQQQVRHSHAGEWGAHLPTHQQCSALSARTLPACRRCKPVPVVHWCPAEATNTFLREVRGQEHRRRSWEGPCDRVPRQQGRRQPCTNPALDHASTLSGQPKAQPVSASSLMTLRRAARPTFRDRACLAQYEVQQAGPHPSFYACPCRHW